MARRFVLLLLLCGCEAPAEIDELAPVPETPVFKMKTKEKTLDGCVAGAEGCTYVRLDYPVIVQAIEGTAVDAITGAIDAFVNAPLQPDGETTTAQALMDEVFTSYRDLKKQYPNYEHPWFIERKAFVVENAPDVLCLSFVSRSFMGGAPGMTTVGFMNLDPQSGAELGLSDFLVDDYEEKLLPIAEARFREVREIEEGMSLADAGFTFADGAFALSDNFGVGEDGVTFYYNAYDVAPYALGATEIVLSYEELDGLLKE